MLAVRTGVAILVDVSDAFLKQVGYEVTVLNGLPKAVNIDRIAEIVIRVTPLFFISQRPNTPLQFARRCSKTKLKRTTEMQ